MTAHQSTGVAVIARFTQDGYDWPNGHHDEQCWTLEKAQPMVPYFREQLATRWKCQTCADTGALQMPPTALEGWRMVPCPVCR